GLCGATLQFAEQAPTDAEPAHGLVDPHSLEFRDRVAAEPQRAAPHQFASQHHYEEETLRRLVVDERGRHSAWSDVAKPCVESPVQLVEVLVETPAATGIRRIPNLEPDQPPPYK